MTTDFELLDAWKAGDSVAGTTLLRRHFKSLHRFFANKVNAGVDDLIQQTMLNLVKSRDRFRGDSSFRTYMFTIARHELYAAFRKKRRDGEMFDPSSQSVADLGTSPSQAVARREEQRLMLMAMHRLPLELQIVIELTYWEELKSDEIAEVLDIPSGTVKSRVRRAKEALRGHMDELARDANLLESTKGDFDGWAASIKECFDPAAAET